MFVALPTEIHEQIDALIDGAIAKCPEAAGERADLRAQLVRYFCEWNHLPTAENIAIQKNPALCGKRQFGDCHCPPGTCMGAS